MLKRLLTTAIMLPILAVVLFFGGGWLLAVTLVLALIGMYEFYTAISKKTLPIHFVGYFFAIIYFISLHVVQDFYLYRDIFFVIMIFFFLAAQFCWVITFKKTTLKNFLATLAGFLYVPFMLSFVYLVRREFVLPHLGGGFVGVGFYFVWMIFISASGSDVFAYLVGRAFGRHKLKGSPSPGKTWEGCFGGILGAALLGCLYGWFLSTNNVKYFDASTPMAFAIVAGIGAIASQMGDLFASAVKRSMGIKDFGNLLPGHGGVLDRFDSIMVTAPLMYFMMWRWVLP